MSSADRADIRQRATREVYANSWLRLREDEIEYAGGTARRRPAVCSTLRGYRFR